MKKILHLTNNTTPFLQLVMDLAPGSYQVDIKHTLEKALLMDLLPYHAVVFDMWFARGNFNNTRELGRYPIELPRDKTWGEQLTNMKEDNQLYNHRMSDSASGFIFGWLARLPHENGGLEFRGGLVTYTHFSYTEVRNMFNLIQYDAITDYRGVILPHEILYLNSLPKDSKDLTSNLEKVVTRAANLYYGGPLSPNYIPGTAFSLS